MVEPSSARIEPPPSAPAPVAKIEGYDKMSFAQRWQAGEARKNGGRWANRPAGNLIKIVLSVWRFASETASACFSALSSIARG